MRNAVALLVGLAAGAAGGWVGHELLPGGAGAPRAAEEEERAGSGAAAPVLAGRHGEDFAMGPLSEETARVLRALEHARPDAAGVRGLASLATLHAIAGNEAEFLRLAERALARGMRLDDLLPALAEFAPDRAAVLLAMLLRRHPEAAFETLGVARMFADGGQPERALALVRAELPRRSELDPELARLLLRLDPQNGARALLDLEGSERWDAEALGVLRALLVESGQDRALLPFLLRALDERPADHSVLRWLRKLDPGAAEARLTALLRTSPQDARAWSLLGDLRRDAGDAAAAFDAYRKAAENDPGRSAFRDLVKADPERGLELVLGWTKDSADDEMLGALGEMYLLAGRKEEAARAFVRAHEHDPADSEWLKRLTEVDASMAVAVLERRLASSPGAADDETLGRYAEALAAAGRPQDAFQQYLAAHRKDPDDEEWQEALVHIDPRAALPVLEVHVRDHPADASGRGAYGLALAAAGRRDEATTHLERALADGDAPRWYAALRDLDADRALVALNRRASSDGRDDDLWGLLGQELHARQRDAEARAAYEAAARLDPANRAWAEALRTLR
jgi:tetratricopeptide (TPR) repeat protein